MISRRAALIGLGAGLIPAPSLAFAPSADPLAAIEATLRGGRLGFAALDLTKRGGLSHRMDERFALCSTAKLPLVGAILAQVDLGRIDGSRTIAISRRDLVEHAPVVVAALPKGSITVFELCRGAIEQSDNAAANMLLAMIGGPAGLTRFMQRHDGGVSRLDRTEPTLNTNLPGDPRDTTTPAAMLRLTRALMVDGALSAASRDRLAGWLIASRTGAARLRAGLPPAWRAGDKTGTGERGAANDVAIVWRHAGHAPLLIASYVDAPAVPLAVREAAHAAAARAVATLLR